MPELRTDWLTARTVLVAENRALRPNEFGEAASAAASSRTAANCPFCPGRESQTPPASYEHVGSAGNWQVRTIPNKYPAVVLDAASIGELPATTCAPAFGVHEVIIESARHIDRMTALSPNELRNVFLKYAHILSHWG
jgi:UDPglucose--hexose-1-phosphate uridylyltransferase